MEPIRVLALSRWEHEENPTRPMFGGKPPNFPSMTLPFSVSDPVECEATLQILSAAMEKPSSSSTAIPAHRTSSSASE